MAEVLQAVFLSEEADRFPTLYPEEIRCRIRKGALLDSNVLSRKDLERPEIRSVLERTQVIFSSWGMPTLSEEEIARFFPHLEAVFYAAGSVQYFARPFLRRGIRVFSAWAANAVPVAEYTVAQIVLAGKGAFQAQRRYREEGREAAWRAAAALPGNYCIRVGILGAGMIGKMVMERLRGYEYEVLCYDPFVPEKALRALGARGASLEEIFSTCRIISNHVANLPATVGLIRADLLERMLPDAVLINTGRGAQVDEAALAREMEKCPARTALLDVTWPEPPEEDSPLLRLPNVFLTPHIAGSLNAEWARMGKYMAEEFERFLAGEPLRYEVTEKKLETMA